MNQRIPVLPLRAIAACLASLLAVTGCGGSGTPATAGADAGSAGAHDAEIRTALGGFHRARDGRQADPCAVDRPGRRPARGLDGRLWPADPATGTPADADTLYRVGSVSKLFTDIAIMQQVEQGKLDIDAPVTTILPDFKPQGEKAPARSPCTS